MTSNRASALMARVSCGCWRRSNSDTMLAKLGHCPATSAQGGRPSLVPLLAALPLYRDARWISHLDPSPARTRAVGRAEPLRYDPFGTEPASVGEHVRSVRQDVLAEPDRTMMAQERRDPGRRGDGSFGDPRIHRRAPRGKAAQVWVKVAKWGVPRPVEFRNLETRGGTPFGELDHGRGLGRAASMPTRASAFWFYRPGLCSPRTPCLRSQASCRQGAKSNSRRSISSRLSFRSGRNSMPPSGCMDGVPFFDRRKKRAARSPRLAID
jgi:hypothetical protein